MNTSFLQRLCVLAAFAFSSFALADGPRKRPPIIDVHVHAMKINANFGGSICPWFLSNMPGGDPHLPQPNFMNTDCANPLKAAESDKEFEDAIVEAAERLNITMVASGDEDVLKSWKSRLGERLIPSVFLRSADDMSPQELEEKLSGDFYKVLGEVAPQYVGMSPSDMSLDEYFGVAEKLGVPVAIHMGTGGNGMANITQPKYRASAGRPFELEDMLARHPKLKIWVMHAGFPMIDEMLALMGAHAYVYVDIAGFIWSYPLAEVNAYIERMVRAGFGKRILYGTDLMLWPKLLETSLGVIENASYLSEDQKRDILFNNAVRFFNYDVRDFQ